jgi:hypothetical protein
MAALAGLWGQGAVAQLSTLPSGIEASLLSIAPDPEIAGVRIRYLAPAIGARNFDLERLSEDMDALCRDAIQPAEGRAPIPDGALIIVAISDRDVPLGVSDPDAVQVFQSYEHIGGDCIWSHF